MVSTDMGTKGAEGFGRSLEELGAITPEHSAKSLLAVIDVAKKETHGGKFWNYSGDEMKY